MPAPGGKLRELISCMRPTADSSFLHSKKCTTCSGLMKTGLNNVLLLTLLML